MHICAVREQVSDQLLVPSTRGEVKRSATILGGGGGGGGGGVKEEEEEEEEEEENTKKASQCMAVSVW
jgi:hypothetical protein